MEKSIDGGYIETGSVHSDGTSCLGPWGGLVAVDLW
jgi:hypothetical protein